MLDFAIFHFDQLHLANVAFARLRINLGVLLHRRDGQSGGTQNACDY